MFQESESSKKYGLLLGEYKFYPEKQSRNYGRTITDVGSFRTQDINYEKPVREAPGVGRLGKGEYPNLRPVAHYETLSVIRASEFRLKAFGLFAGKPLPPALFAVQTIEVTDDAKQRLANHEVLARKIYSVICEQLNAFQSIAKIRVRPSWSHEYDDETGIVIDVELKVDSELRFLLWDVISAKVSDLRNISDDDRAFIQNNISINLITAD